MKNVNFTPRETVRELDRYIIGQHKSNRAVAIALRNRWRLQQVTSELRDVEGIDRCANPSRARPLLAEDCHGTP